MAEHNPYAPSRATLTARDNPGSGDSQDVWRDGKWLVMSPGASLPARCVKCNAPALEPTKLRKLHWHHPAIYLVILVQIVIYLIVALATRKTVQVNPGLCAEHKSKRRRAGIITACGLVGSILLPVAVSSIVTDRDLFGLNLSLCVIGILGFTIYGTIAMRIVYAKKIDADEVRIGGCGEEFLASLSNYR